MSNTITYHHDVMEGTSMFRVGVNGESVGAIVIKDWMYVYVCTERKDLDPKLKLLSAVLEYRLGGVYDLESIQTAIEKTFTHPDVE